MTTHVENMSYFLNWIYLTRRFDGLRSRKKITVKIKQDIMMSFNWSLK